MFIHLALRRGLFSCRSNSPCHAARKLGRTRRPTVEQLEHRNLLVVSPLSVVQFEGALADRANAITVDTAGNRYLVGQFEGTVDVDPGPGITNLTSIPLDASQPPGATNAGRDLFLAKYASDGSLLWARNFSGYFGANYASHWDIEVDAEQNIYVLCDSHGTVNFDSLSVTAPRWNYSMLIGVRFNTDGTTAWAKPFGDAFDGIEPFSMALFDSVDNSRDAIYLAGSFDGTEQFGAQTLIATPGSTDAFLSRLDAATGDFEWTIRSTGKGHEHVWGMAIDATDGPDGTAYLTGRGYDDVAFGSTKWRGGYSGFVAKVPLSESGGSFQWAKPISSRTNKNALIESREVAIWNHNVLVTGHTAAKDVQFGALTITNLHVNTHDIFVTQLSASGNFHWAFFAGSSGSDYPIAMAADTFGNIFLTGSVGGAAAFGSDTVSAGSFVSQLSAATGQFIKSWGFSEGAVTTGNTVRALATSSTGNLLVTGGFVGTMTFPGGITLTSTNNTRDTFVLEFAPATGVNAPRSLLTSPFRESDNVQTRALQAFLDEEAFSTSFRRHRKMLATVSPTILGSPKG